MHESQNCTNYITEVLGPISKRKKNMQIEMLLTTLRAVSNLF